MIRAQYVTSVISGNAIIENNTASKHGGGIHSAYKLTISGGTIRNNHADGRAGGIFHISGNGKLTLEGGSVSGNAEGTNKVSSGVIDYRNYAQSGTYSDTLSNTNDGGYISNYVFTMVYMSNSFSCTDTIYTNRPLRITAWDTTLNNSYTIEPLVTSSALSVSASYGGALPLGNFVVFGDTEEIKPDLSKFSSTGYTLIKKDTLDRFVFYGVPLTAPSITLSVEDGKLQYNITEVSSETDAISNYEIQLYQEDGTTKVGDPISVTSLTGDLTVESGTYRASVRAIDKKKNESNHIVTSITQYCESDWGALSEAANYTAGVTPTPTTYTITFNANNGSDETDSKPIADGSEYTLTDDIFTYGKCEIESWNTAADGSGTSYNIEDKITVTENTTLYAQWVLPLNNLEAFTDGALEWSGNSASPYTFTMKNGAELYARVILPANTNDDKSTIVVNGDCEIKGSISFVSGTGMAGSSHKGDLTVNGAGSLTFNEFVSTGSGDTLTILADTTINKEINIGASGGMDSKIVIKNAKLTAPRVVLLHYLTMEDNAKLNITNSGVSFHSDPQINLSDKSEIHITGDGTSCVLYKEGGAHSAFDNLISNKWFPEGYSFKDDGSYSLYNESGNLETGSVIIKKTQSAPIPSSSGGTTRYTVKFDTDGGSKVANKSVRRNSKLEEPDAPEKEGYTFMGWFTDEELTTAYDFDSKVTKSFTLYAKWEKVDDDEHGTSGHNCPSLKFGDLDITQWYHLDTDYVIENDLFKGTTETTFAPNDKLTRAMLVTVLYRAEGEPEVTGEATFEDIDSNAYYAKAVVWGQQNGIIKGYSKTEFAPDQNIIREQIAAIMHRYAQYKGYDVSVGENTNILSYDDFDSISEYAIGSMQWAVGSGLIEGRTESTLNPQDNATRAEAAAILRRFLTKIK